ncbi:MAG: OmpA/MotB family protein [Christensenellales bacterium]
MSRDRRQGANYESDSDGSWVTSYGDLVTLMLCLFVLLFCFSNIDANKWRAFVRAFSNTSDIEEVDPESIGIVSDEEGGFPQRGHTGTFDNGDEIDTTDMTPENQLYIKIKDHVQYTGMHMQVQVVKYDEAVVMHIVDSALFDSGKDVVREDAKPLLDGIADMILDFQEDIGIVKIEGHTDNVPIKTARFASNWELSAHRAVNVLTYLVETSGFDPAKFLVMGYGEYRPIADNDTEAGKARNRRVDFVFESAGGQ